MAVPPLPNMSLNGGDGGGSSIKGDTRSTSMFDASGFSVNYGTSLGNSSTAAGGLPWLWIGLAAGAYWLWKKNKA